jgi:hypothetical protein
MKNSLKKEKEAVERKLMSSSTLNFELDINNPNRAG